MRHARGVGSPFEAEQRNQGWWPGFKAQLGRLMGGLVALLHFVPGVRRWVPADGVSDGAMRRTGSELFDRQSGSAFLTPEYHHENGPGVLSSMGF